MSESKIIYLDRTQIEERIAKLEAQIPELKYYSGEQFLPPIRNEIAALKWVLAKAIT